MTKFLVLTPEIAWRIYWRDPTRRYGNQPRTVYNRILKSFQEVLDHPCDCEK